MRIWEDGILELAAAARGRIAPLASAGRGRASPASRSAPTGSTTSTTLAPTLDALRGTRLPLRAPGRRRRRRPRRPPGGRRSSTTRARCSARTSPGSPAPRSAGPTSRSCSRSSPAARPIQLERLASRGVDVRSSLHRNVFFDTASYGRRALELCIETFGVEQLVFGTRRPGRRSDAGDPGRRRVRRVCRQTHPSGQPAWIAAVNRHRDMARWTSRGRSRPHAPRAARALGGDRSRALALGGPRPPRRGRPPLRAAVPRPEHRHLADLLGRERRTRATTITIARRARSTSARARSSRTTSAATRTAGSASRRSGTTPAGSSTSTRPTSTACATPRARPRSRSTATRPRSGAWATTSPTRTASCGASR